MIDDMRSKALKRFNHLAKIISESEDENFLIFCDKCIKYIDVHNDRVSRLNEIDECLKVQDENTLERIWWLTFELKDNSMRYTRAYDDLVECIKNDLVNFHLEHLRMLLRINHLENALERNGRYDV